MAVSQVGWHRGELHELQWVKPVHRAIHSISIFRSTSALNGHARTRIKVKEH